MSVEAIKAIQMVYANTTKHDWPDDIWDAICQAIEAEKHEVSQEPVAWMYTSHYKGDERYITKYQVDLSTYKADKVWPLYTIPQPKREPLTDAPLYLSNLVTALDNAFISSWQSTHHWKKQLDEARDYLAAHGIKEKNT